MDLYNGHTSLLFLYSNYVKGVRESEVAKVLALLDYYGTSLGIAGRSNNLAHKLMLGGQTRRSGDLGRSAQEVVFEGASYRVFSFRVLGVVVFSGSAGKNRKPPGTN